MNKHLQKILLEWPNVMIRDHDLAAFLPGNDQTRYDLVSWALKTKILEKLKRGVYLIKPPYQKYLVNEFEIAQIIYGPSYISFSSSLSHYGLIPEAVYATTSACFKRSTTFKTPLGIFQYSHVPIEEFMLGVTRHEGLHEVYFIAAPWKALADLCYVQKKSWKSLSELCEDLRIEQEELKGHDGALLLELSKRYGSPRVRNFLKNLYNEIE